MRMVSSICSAVLIVVLIQISLQILKEKYELQLVRYKCLIVSKSVLLISVGSAFVSVIVQCIKWERYRLPEMILIIFLLAGVSVLTVTDYKMQVIPNPYMISMIAFWVVVVFVYTLTDVSDGFQLVLQSIFGGFFCGILFLVCYLLSKRQLGAGDVKISVVIGLYLGVSLALNVFLYGSILCCAYSLIQVARKKLGWKDGVPMVPFFMAGIWLVLLIA